jgi:parallel beta-helix repeat protein
MIIDNVSTNFLFQGRKMVPEEVEQQVKGALGTHRISGFRLAAVLMLIGMSNFVPSVASATTWYVNQNNAQCNNSGPGTDQEPFCTISAGAASAVAGDTVMVASGIYAEVVTVAKSGTTGKPITFTAFPIGAVTVTGGAYGFNVSGQQWVTISGFIVSNTTSSGIRVASSSNITLSNNQIENTGDRGIYITQSSGVNVADSQIEDTKTYGIQAYYSSEIYIFGNHVTQAGQPVSGQTYSGIYFNNTVNSQISNNVADYNTEAGIYLVNGCTNVQVVGNSLSHNARGYTRAAPGINVQTSSGNTVESNISYNNEDSGLQFYPGGGGNLVVNNISYNNGDHGIDDYDSPNQLIVGNTVYNNVTAGINLEGANGSPGAQLANNISVDNGLKSSPGTKGNIRLDSKSISQSAIDYDVVFQNQQGNVMFTWGNNTYASLVDFTAATGMETYGLQADPQWQNASSGNFDLLPNSAAIDSANSGASGALGMDSKFGSRFDDPQVQDTGAGPRTYDDRGAFELQGADLPPTVSITAPQGGATVVGTVNVTASAAGEYNAVAGVQFELDGSNLGSQDSQAPYQISWDTTTVADGAHTLTAVASDTAGHTATSDPVSVTVNNSVPTTTLKFLPTDDATIIAGSSNSNYGSNPKLWVDDASAGVYDFLIKFSVSGVGAKQVSSAQLWLYNNNSSNKGGDFYPVTDSSWSEKSITWNNAPAAGTNLVASLEAVSPGNWVMVDVTPLITGDGTYSLRVKSTSADSAGYYSKETPEFAPNLVIDVK